MKLFKVNFFKAPQNPHNLSKTDVLTQYSAKILSVRVIPVSINAGFKWVGLC